MGYIADEVVRVVVKMDSNDVDRLKVIAELKGVNFSELVRQVLKHYADSKNEAVKEFQQARDKINSMDF